MIMKIMLTMKKVMKLLIMMIMPKMVK